ncbi:CBS domain-containing protein [Halopiger xanaduensis]|uniref:Zinc metalloprotease n=1 Tax=Halopiger xanaduensis (strain DSM 18323 / JCM 14033 / SH-6) TaxID=797210 RepID=F8DDD3_HALXS|nr:CBS domain-containing protein [Halopiger xanaduensis]AEH39023.1 peptidase M50 [Halopiger xanaduensis SH-6]
MASFRIGRIFGIPIELDLTFLLVLPLFAWVIGSQVEFWIDILGILPEATPSSGALTEGSTPWLLGLASAVGLFVGVLLHELGHSVVALHYGLTIESIKLWLLGGVAQFTEMPEDWRQEFAVAVAGPIVSVAVGVVSYVAFVALPVDLPAARFVLGYLALMNVALAGFNMLPGFPMDGGRVLRALLARNRTHVRATEIAAAVGKAFAVLLGLLGLVAFDLIMIALAFFIYMGASGEAQQTAMKAAFEGVTVRDIMTPVADLETVTEETTVADLLDRMLRERHVGYPVLRNGRFAGMVTLEDTQSVREVERDAYRVGDVMTEAGDVPTIRPDQPVMDALETMQGEGVGRMPVMNADGELAGLISRTDLMMAFNIAQSGGSLGPIQTQERLLERP